VSAEVGLQHEWSGHIADLFHTEPIIIPSIVAAELVHGIYRAQTPKQFVDRERYIEDLLAAYNIASFSGATAWLAGRLRGEQAQLGNTLPLADSFIAATAVELDCDVLTHNVKDFIRIPGLKVIPFSLPQR
jgi:tRNA(fMet)-specific endonuclease VapC